MGTRADLADDLQRVTRIDKTYLTGPSAAREASLRNASVATKMSWMAGRVTKQVEDIAYSMLGLFNVNLTPQYCEGCEAFMRLQRVILESSTDKSIFAWTVPRQGLTCYRKGKQALTTPNWPPFPSRWGLLAPSPDCFSGYGDVVIIHDKIVARLAGGYKWTQQGMHFKVPIRAVTNLLGLAKSKLISPSIAGEKSTTGSQKPLLSSLPRLRMSGNATVTCWIGQKCRATNGRVQQTDFLKHRLRYGSLSSRWCGLSVLDSII